MLAFIAGVVVGVTLGFTAGVYAACVQEADHDEE